MSETSVLREEVKRYIDKVDDKILEIVYRILEATDEINDPIVNMSAEQEKSLKKSLNQANKGQTITYENILKK